MLATRRRVSAEPARLPSDRYKFSHPIQLFFLVIGTIVQLLRFSRMGSEGADLVGGPVEASTRPDSSRRGPGKVSKKIHKAAREKLKRDHMNELFLDLGQTLDLDHPDNGKASILRETIRLFGELQTQVDNLKEENATLLSESNYVTVEKNELLEETCVLDAEIKRLKREIDEKTNGSSIDASQSQPNATDQQSEAHVAFPLVAHAADSTSVSCPVFFMPLQHESQGYPGPLSEINMAKGLSSVSRPQPRYPSSSDSWPSHILTKQTNIVEVWESCTGRSGIRKSADET